jgi:hypothetical protein
MSTLILEVDDKQKEAIRLLAELMNISIKEVESETSLQNGNLEQALKQVFGLWKDNPIDFEEWRKQAWGGRGV